MVEFKVIYNKQINQKLAEIQINNVKTGFRKLSIFFYFCSAVMLILALTLIDEKSLMYWCLGIAVFIFLFAMFLPKLSSKKIKDNYKKIDENSSLVSELTEELYKFDEDKVYIFTTMGTKYRSAVETEYDYFVKVNEDATSYLLYISDVQCYVIFKKDLQKGTLEEFENLLKKHFSQDQYIKSMEPQKKEK